MIINMASRAASSGQMNFGSLSVSKAQPPGALTTPLGSTGGESVSAPKDSLYGNFGKEMTRRLTEALKKNGVSQEAKTEASVLSQSLVGAMGEIEQQFGRDAATEVMAKILTGTAEGLGEDSLISSIQNALAGLKRLDPNGTGLKRLAESFNRDLALALDPEQLDEKLTKGETLSLSCALSKHFGTLAPLEDDNDDLSGSGQRTDLLESSVSPQAAKETFEMFGFDETGRWDLVKVVKDDNLSAEELKEAAEAGVTKAMELTMGTILENGSGLDLFQNLANFLEKDLQDKEAAAFVEKCIEDSFNLPPDKRGLSPKLAQMLSQVYSKMAAEGDVDKLTILENYINTDFKNALNPILAEMQKGDDPILPGVEVGELQFKGLNGVSLGGENDVFSLNWGYKDDDTYDKTLTKRFLQEDIREVKAAKEKIDQAVQGELIKNWDETAEEKRQREEREAKSGRAPAEGADLRTSRADRYAAERHREQLDEAMTVKVGQLSDSSREELENYLKEHFQEEEAEKLLEHVQWNNDLMSGMADLYRDIQESGGDDNKAREFLSFLNGSIKKEVEKIASDLGSLSFEGWQAAEDETGALTASFKFAGRENMVRVTILGTDQSLMGEADSDQAGPIDADQLLNQSPAPGTGDDTPADRSATSSLRKLGTGYLVDLLA